MKKQITMAEAVKELQEVYPDIEWETAEPHPDVEANFGTGIVLAGTKDGETKTFFILEEDPRKVQWGHVIANYLNRTVVEDVK